MLVKNTESMTLLLMTMYYMYMYTLYPTELLYPLQGGDTPLLLAVKGHTTCVERLLSTPGIDVNIKDKVSSTIFLLLFINHTSFYFT